MKINGNVFTTRTYQEEYNSNVEKFINGEITRRVFMNGGVNSVAYCLYLMQD